MKRLDFLKRLGIGAAAIVVAPKVLAEITEEEVSHGFDTALLDKRISKIKKGNIPVTTHLTCWHKPSPEDIIQIWRQTGQLLYTNG